MDREIESANGLRTPWYANEKPPRKAASHFDWLDDVHKTAVSNLVPSSKGRVTTTNRQPRPRARVDIEPSQPALPRLEYIRCLSQAEATEKLLEETTLALVDQIRQCNWANAYQHFCSEDFVKRYELPTGEIVEMDKQSNGTLGETLDARHKEKQGSFSVEIMSVVAKMDPRIGHAVVWISLCTREGEEGGQRERVVTNSWRRESVESGEAGLIEPGGGARWVMFQVTVSSWIPALLY